MKSASTDVSSADTARDSSTRDEVGQSAHPTDPQQDKAIKRIPDPFCDLDNGVDDSDLVLLDAVKCDHSKSEYKMTDADQSVLEGIVDDMEDDDF
jgi:hypothetical protein